MFSKSGGDSAVDTPVPIPNTEVKHCNSENSPFGQRSRAAGLFLFFVYINMEGKQV